MAFAGDHVRLAPLLQALIAARYVRDVASPWPAKAIPGHLESLKAARRPAGIAVRQHSNGRA